MAGVDWRWQELIGDGRERSKQEISGNGVRTVGF